MRIYYCLVTFVGFMVASAAGQTPDEKPEEPEYSLLISFNVVDRNSPENTLLKVGDLVLLSVGPPPGTKGVLTYTIRGDALERFALVQQATPFPEAGQFQATHVNQPLLRATKPGKATLSVTVTHGGTWKETREFEFTVTEKRQSPLRFGP